jgi:predicted ATPase
MGKSSFVDVVLLAYQNRFSLVVGNFPLNGSLVKLNTARDVLYQYAKDETISFSITSMNKDLIHLKFKANAGNDFLLFDDALSPVDKSAAAPIEALTRTAEERNRIVQKLLRVFKNIIRLEASRILPQSLFPKSMSGISSDNLGLNGELTPHYLVVHGAERINNENLIHERANSNSLMEQVNLWLGEVSPDIRVIFEELPGVDSIKMEVQYKQTSRGYTNKFKPNHVGFGISYALPVITALLIAQKGEMVIIDSPESNLHPRGQAVIGRLAALAAANGVQVILETHSDHIINGIRVAVKEGKIHCNDVALFYFGRKITDMEQYADVNRIGVDGGGELTHYPDDLLSEWSNQLMRLV